MSPPDSYSVSGWEFGPFRVEDSGSDTISMMCADRVLYEANSMKDMEHAINHVQNKYRHSCKEIMCKEPDRLILGKTLEIKNPQPKIPANTADSRRVAKSLEEGLNRMTDRYLQGRNTQFVFDRGDSSWLLVTQGSLVDKFVHTKERQITHQDKAGAMGGPSNPEHRVKLDEIYRSMQAMQKQIAKMSSPEEQARQAQNIKLDIYKQFVGEKDELKSRERNKDRQNYLQVYEALEPQVDPKNDKAFMPSILNAGTSNHLSSRLDCLKDYGKKMFNIYSNADYSYMAE